MEKVKEVIESTNKNLPQKIAIGAAALIVVFLLGYVPSCVGARNAEEQRAELEKKLKMAELRSQLGMASYEANRNNYANASEFSTNFFNGLRAAIDSAEDDEVKKKLQAMMALRDEITTNLAQADPVVKEKLARMYADFYRLLAISHQPSAVSLQPSDIRASIQPPYYTDILRAGGIDSFPQFAELRKHLQAGCLRSQEKLP
ncbi:MAG: hypothetical protein L0229_06070, partial [Blastocatellia bacterium]|nr:hypothetical protein [Blastocatellia bacterium]